MEIHSLEDDIEVKQNMYINNLQPSPVDYMRATERGAPLTESELLKSRIGQILWLVRQSMPDIMCDISMLASGTKHAAVQTSHCTNKLIRKLNSEQLTLRFQYLGEDNSKTSVV